MAEKQHSRTKVLAIGFTEKERYELREFTTRSGATEYSVVNPDGKLLWVIVRTSSKAEAISVLRDLTSEPATGTGA
jgi:hypothetical protein